MSITEPTSWQEIERSQGPKYDKIIEIINTVNSLVAGIGIIEWQDPVLDKDLSTPPVSPSTGDRYIIASGGSGDWSSKDDQIAEWDGSVWVFHNPIEGAMAWVRDEDIYYQFTSSWAPWINQAVTTTSSPTFNAIRFDTSPTITPAEGDLYWDATDNTLNIKTETDTILRTGQAELLIGINNTGVTLNKGDIVYISGAASNRPEFTLANANAWETSEENNIGILTADITNGSTGYVAVSGLVRDLDTSSFSAGDRLYLDTTDGQVTATVPAFPIFVISIGYVTSVHATAGVIFFDVDNNRNQDFYNGTFVESIDALITSDGATITLSLEREGGGDLTMRFSDAYTTLDTTPALTIALTAGSDTVPQDNFLYIPKSTKVLTNSTSTFPTTTEHIKVAYVRVQSASAVQTNGALINQNWNDHSADVNGPGHMAETSERIRRIGAQWFSGIAGAGVDNYLTVSAGNAHFKSASGVIYQMHRHAFAAFDQSTGGIVHIINDSVTPFLASTNLDTDVTADNTGAAIGNNKYFNLVFWGVGNKEGEYAPIMCNLPGGFYNTQSDCENDVSGYDVTSIPREFSIESSTGFLICRITIQMGATWTVVSTRDLRGSTSTTVSGGGAGVALTKFLDSLFDIHNLTDSTKIAEFDASGISTATTRTFIFPDSDGTLALTSGKYTDAEAVAAVEAAGLALATTKVITSADEDINFVFGRAGVGFASYVDYAAFGHRDLMSAGNYALAQVSDGNVFLNASTARTLSFRINHAAIMNMNVSGLQLGSGARITTILDEDAMGSDSATAGATQQSIKAYFDAFNAIGSGNALWAEMAYGSGNVDAIAGTGNGWSIKQTGTNFSIVFYVMQPKNLGSLSLYLSDMRITLTDADGSNYITRTLLRALNVTGGVASLTTLDDDTGNRDTIAIHDDYAFSAVDVSAYERIGLTIQTVVGTADDLEIGSCEIKYYYA